VTVPGPAGVTPPVSNDPPVPDLVLERYHLGELPEAHAARLLERLRTDAALQARLDQLVQSDAEIRESALVQQLAARVTEQAEDRPRLATGGFSQRHLAMAMAGILVSILAVWQPWARDPGHAQGASDSDDRIKGDSTLLLYRKTGTGSELLSDGAPGKSGDLVRVGYRIANACFGIIVSVDGNGVVTRHLPMSGEIAPALQAGGVILLESAYELDAAPGWERFFLVTRKTEFTVESVLEAARSAVATSPAAPPAMLALGADFQQTSFMLQKPR